MCAAIVVSASYDKQIRLWDAASGRTVKSFAFPESQINSLFLLPETGFLAVAGFGVLRLYDLATYLHSPGGPVAGMNPNMAAAGAGAGGATNANPAPPIYSSFESQSSMNFTSLTAVPLLRNANDDQSSTFSGSSRQFNDSASSMMLNDQLLGTVVLSDLGNVLSRGFKEVVSLLIVTSEDGHIRFFDSNSAVTLRVLKDIATGAAITCSAVSPDRKYLLTGNQMGQVSLWHLPSIVASVAIEIKNSSNKANANRSAAAANANTTTAATGSVMSDAVADSEAAAALALEKEKEKMQAELAKAFGRHPMQDVNFANDYSAIRSIAIEPLCRWAAVATNAGKVHFIRLAREPTVHGSKAVPASVAAGNEATDSANPSTATGPQTPRDAQARSAKSADGTPQISPQKSTGGDSRSNTPSSRLQLTGQVELRPDCNTSTPGSNSYHGPRESIYRSALVVNELKTNARRASDATMEDGNGLGGELMNSAGRRSGASVHNSMGAVLLDNLEQQHNSMSARNNNSSVVGGQLSLTSQAAANSLTSQSVAAHLAEQFEMEVFDTIQAHYKYILRVLIAPNSELLVTCSADYSVGRYVIPVGLRTSASPAASPVSGVDKNVGPMPDLATGAATGAAGGPLSAQRQSATAGDEPAPPPPQEEPCNDIFSPSFASTQGPHGEASPVEKAVEASAKAAGSPDAAGAGATATKPGGSAPAASLVQSFDGSASRAMDDANLDPAMEFKPLKPLTGHQRWVWDGAFSDCSNFFFTASSDNTLRMWNGLTTERPQSVSFVGHTKPVVAVLLCYDRRRTSGGSSSS